MEKNPKDGLEEKIPTKQVSSSMTVGKKINELINLGYTVEIAGSSGGLEVGKFIHLTLARPGDIWRDEAANISIMTDGDNPDMKILFTLQKMQEAIESGT